MVDNSTRALEFALSVKGGAPILTPVTYESSDLDQSVWPILSAHAILRAGQYVVLFERRNPVVRNGQTYDLEIGAGGCFDPNDGGDGRITALRELYEEGEFAALGISPEDVEVKESIIYTFDHLRRHPDRQCRGPLHYAILRVDIDEQLARQLVHVHDGNEEVVQLHFASCSSLQNGDDPLRARIIPFQRDEFLDGLPRFYQ